MVALVVDRLGRNYDQFLEYRRDPDTPGPVLSPKRFSLALHIDLQSLAEQAHLHRNTSSRAHGSASVQPFLRDALKVLKAGIDVSGAVNRALFWYRNDPMPAFGYKTADQRVGEGRIEDVLRYTASLATGAAG